jgi:flagellar hook-associated protein 1 FlgK
MASLLNIGVSGLRVNQTALQVTGNNIANADVESYTRQRTDFVTSPGQATGNGYIGSGSSVETITRLADQFVRTQIQLDTANYNNLSAFGDNIEQLDTLLAGELSSLGPGITALFSAIEVSAEDPTSNPARQLVLSEAEGLVERLHTLYDRLQQQASSVDEQMSSLTAQVSSLASGIADLNESIEREMGINPNSQPNGLLDSRDELLRQLTEIVSIRTTEDASGAVNVFVGNGQPIVIGRLASSLGTQASLKDTEIQDITFIGANGQPIPITESISGGELGGLLEFRERALGPTLNDMGRIALAITDSINQQNEQGIDLEGNYGSLVFNDINSTARMAERSKTLDGSANLDVVITDLSKLGTDNYILSINNTGPPPQGQLVNQSTGEVIAGSFAEIDHDGNPNTGNENVFIPNDASKTEGITLYVNSGTLAQGDSFFIRPTRSGARDVEMQMTRLQTLAFAAPIVTDATLSNSGGGTISAGTVLQAQDRFGNVSPAFVTEGQLSPPVNIQFTSPSSYDVYDSSSNPPTLMFSGTFAQGQNNAVFATDASSTQLIASADVANTGGAAIGASQVVDQQAFAAADPAGYVITFADDAGGLPPAPYFTVAGNSDGSSVNVLSSGINNTLSLNGWSVTVGGTPDDGDSFNLSTPAPVNMTALATPGNSGAGQLSASSVTNATTFAAADPGGYTISYDDDAAGLPPAPFFVVTGNSDLSSVNVSATGATTSISLNGWSTTISGVPDNGDSFAIEASAPFYMGYQVDLGGSPQSGDSFTVGFNGSGISDNRNAVRIGQLRVEGILQGGTLNFEADYGRLVEHLGAETAQNRISRESGYSLLQSSINNRSSVSGVNLDEEAANLIRFEQAYNASAQVISVARQLFDTMLNTFR